jgi:nucleoside-diphosphate-sugar epimerase
MRVVVVGATGNVGTSLLESLAIEEQVDEIVAIARRRPARAYPRTSFASADITASELEPIFRGADAVVHLAWLIQPARKESVTYTVNVSGSERVFRAAVQARVPAIVYASSVGAYSPGPKDRFVDPRAILSDVRGAFNLAAEPVLDPAELGAMLHARPVRIPARALRAAAAITFALHLQPSEPGWVDMALAVPLLDAGRARRELGWEPRRSATDALAELMEGMRSGSDLDTPPLARGR